MANKKLSAIISIGGAVAGSLLGSIDKTKSKLGEVGQALKNLEAQQGKLGRAIQTFGRDGKNVDGMRQRYQALTREIEKQRAALEKVQRIEKNRADNLAKQNGTRGKLGETAAMGAAVAVPAFMLSSKAAKFNYDLKMIGLTADMSDKAIREMGADIGALSTKTGQSSDRIKDAMAFLVAAGQDVGTARDNLMTVGKTATATGSEIEDVAKASYILGSALKIDTLGMEKALAALVQAGKEGRFEFRDMAAELPILGSSFQALKFTGQDAVASMGAYLQIAMEGASTQSEAANNMSNFLAKILSPETLKKSEKLGGNLYGVISGAQAKGKNPIEAAIKEINRITKGGDQKLLGELFSDMQVQNFVRPVLQNLEKYEKVKSKVLGAGDVINTDFARVMSEDKLAMDQLANSFSDLGKSIGESLNPAISKMATVLTPIVTTVRDFVTANKELVGNLTLAVGAFFAVRGAILGARLAMLALSFVMVANPIGLAVAAIGAAAVLVITYWEPIKKFFIDLWADIVAVFDKSVDYIVGKIQAIVDKFNAAKATVTNFGSGIGDSVYNGVQATKSFFGVDDAQTRAYEASQGVTRTPPPMATGRGSGGTVTDNSQTTYQIYQQPGQDPNDLAAALTREQERRRAIMKRGALFDGAMAQ